MNICIFEDAKYKNLHPLTLSRPVWELRTGARTLRQKLSSLFGAERTFLLTRDYLEDVAREGDATVSFDIPPEPLLFVNGRMLADPQLAGTVGSAREKLFYSGEDLAAAQVPDGAAFAERLESGDLEGYRSEPIEARLIEYPWQLIEHNGAEIEKEFPLFGADEESKTEATLLHADRIHIGKNVVILPGTVIDAGEGPVIIEDEVKVLAGCYLKGPLFIGEKSLIKAGARLYGPCSIGSTCKIGGEVTGTVFHGYANKQHDGFMGHSYIGEWVNIGAGTNNSDLKNNYGPVTVPINNEPTATGLTFVGTFMGDHSKTAINTSINTGTVIGFSVNLFGEGFPPKFVPSFSWGGKRKFMTFKLQDAVRTAQIVMERRNRSMSEAYRNMMSAIFEKTGGMRHYGV